MINRSRTISRRRGGASLNLFPLLAACAFLIMGCAAGRARPQDYSAGDLIAMGESTLSAESEGTRVAMIATSEAATLAAGQTAQVLEVRQTEQAMHATATAQAVELGSTQAAATAIVRASETAEAATATRIADIQQREALALERQKRIEWVNGIAAAFRPVLELTALIILIVLGAFAAYRIIRMVEFRARIVPSDTNGLAQTVYHAELPRAISDPEGVARIARAYAGVPQQPPPMPTHHDPIPAARPPAQLSSPQTLPQIAPWRVFEANARPGRGLPIGMSAAGLLIADPETYAHWMIAGTTGSGKTRFGLRPLIAGALAAGWRVIILDRSGLDFLPFKFHPNAFTMVLGDAPEDSVGYLRRAYLAILARFHMLRRAGASTWGRYDGAGPRELIVLDEFSNLADGLESGDRTDLWRYTRMIAAEGRKAGIHLAIALQDPTHKSIDVRIRRNATPLSFRLRDNAASHAVLGAGGADALSPRHFLTVMNSAVTQGVAFAPDDADISDFLQRRTLRALGEPDWLHAEAGTDTAGPPCIAGTDTGTGIDTPDWVGNADPGALTQEQKNTIRRMAAEGISLNEIQKHVFGYKGGAAYRAVRSVIDEPSDLDVSNGGFTP